MKIAIASDHAGFHLKEEIEAWLITLNHEVRDFGAESFEADDDYPDFVLPAAQAVSKGECERGIVLGGSGQGEAIAANKVLGIRAVVFNGQYQPGDGREVPPEITLSREHNDANVLSLGARFLTLEEAQNAITDWLQTSFSNDERHQRRLEKISKFEQNHNR